jgi:hypothetical protein
MMDHCQTAYGTFVCAVVERLFLLMAVGFQALFPLVLRHLAFSPFFYGTHGNFGLFLCLARRRWFLLTRLPIA